MNALAQRGLFGKFFPSMTTLFGKNIFLAPAILSTLVLGTIGWQSIQAVSAKTRRVERPLDASVQIFSRLYTRHDRDYAGRVIDIQQRHKFPDGIYAKAICVRQPDGTQKWLSFERARDEYLMKAD